MTKQFINFSIGRGYLPNWQYKEALREIYQNYLDYGKYDEVIETKDDYTIVTLTNDYLPEGLEFLQLGKSVKSAGSIGEHGEGLKMAMFVLTRLGMYISINTKDLIITGEFKDSIIGETFGLNIKRFDSTINELSEGFVIKFTVPTVEFIRFKAKVITENDILHTDIYHGKIVNKPKGEIYSGGLYVTTVKNYTKAYDIDPEHLSLDRDRSMPSTFDLNYHSSKLNESYGKLNAKDFTHSDTLFISNIPNTTKKQFTPQRIGNSIKFTYKDSIGKERVLNNEALADNLKSSNIFKDTIRYLKSLIFKGLGIYDLLIEFEKKHITTSEAKLDFDIILNLAKK